MEYDRINVPKGIVNKSNGSLECVICYYWYFFKINFRFNSKVYNDCHDIMKNAMSFNDVVIVSVKGNYYRIRFCYMSKEEAKNLFKNPDLMEKVECSKIKNE